MADLNKLQIALGPRGLHLLAISVDADLNLLREYLLSERSNLSAAVLVDRNQQWSGATLGIPGLPTTYLVGKDEQILEIWVGPRAWAEPAIQAGIAARTGLSQ